MVMSVGFTVNPKMSVACSLVYGKPFCPYPAPASRRILLVIGEFQVTWYKPAGQKLHAVCASGAALSLCPRTWYDCVSKKPLILCRGDACQVTRPAWLFNHSLEYAIRSRSGV